MGALTIVLADDHHVVRQGLKSLLETELACVVVGEAADGFAAAALAERLRVLAGGIAHDFNNLLTGVLGNAELARFDLPDESPAHDSLAQIEGIVHRATDLTRQLRAYASDVPMLIEPLDLNGRLSSRQRRWVL